MPSDPSGKVQVVNELIAYPHTCAMCGIHAGPSRRVDGRKMEFADLNLNYEFYGAFYLCEDCVWEIAEAFGCLSPTATSLILNQLAEQKELNEQLRKDVKELNDALGNRVLNNLTLSVNTDSNGKILTNTTGYTGNQSSTKGTDF